MCCLYNSTNKNKILTDASQNKIGKPVLELSKWVETSLCFHDDKNIVSHLLFIIEYILILSLSILGP